MARPAGRKDGKAVLLYDHYDIWSIAPDGTGAKNITAGYGRAARLQLRYVRTETDPRERWIDPAKPLLLHGDEPEDLRRPDSSADRWRAANPSN